jgi:hypothetical protein
MSDDILNRAKERLKELDATIREAERERDELGIFVKTYQRLASPPNMYGAKFGVPTTIQAISKKVLIEQAAEEVLKEMQPLQTAELLVQLRSRNVIVGGADEAINLSSYLSKSDKFINSRKDGGWFLATEFQRRQKEEAPQAVEDTDGL